MALSVFPFIGGKTNVANWIIGNLPPHRVYVEPFGGSAAVLLNKPRSNIEVYNDVDRDIVQFFDVLRNQTEELVGWVKATPFSEELHNEWGVAFYEGHRPYDPVERAGRFLYLRYSQFASKYHEHSGFKRDTLRARVGESRSWARVPSKIRKTVNRLEGVSIQHNDYHDVIERYDDAETVFYCDPPYLGKEYMYPAGSEFKHAELADALHGIDGYAMVSYLEIPEGLYDGWHVETRKSSHNAGARDENNTKDVLERLFCNFDPEEHGDFTDADQLMLGDSV